MTRPFLETLDDRGLLPSEAVGAVRNPSRDQTIEVTNPATGELIGLVPAMGSAQTRALIDAAVEAFGAWRALLPQERARALWHWCEGIRRAREDLARVMTVEQGKPLTESRAEIDYAASFVEWYAEEAKRANIESVTSHLSSRCIMVSREPVGVVAAITPWNFPCAMVTRKVSAALAAGCAIVTKPASQTPFSAIALMELARRAGVPAGVFSVVTGRHDDVVNPLCSDERIRAVSFTGSTEVGRRLLAACAPTIKRMVMELGGHAPFIVFPDMDLETAVKGAVSAKFQTSGQDCLAANRIFVHADIYDEFVRLYCDSTRNLEIGNGLRPGVDIGPLINEQAVAKCEEHVSDALRRGARLGAGGHRHLLGRNFFQPTVLVDVTDEMQIAVEETFGPVAAILRFREETEVVMRANATIYGLAAYVWSRDVERAIRIAANLEYGMIAINCVKMTGPSVPFGGMKQSGLGREGSRHGMEHFTEIKYICMATART